MSLSSGLGTWLAETSYVIGRTIRRCFLVCRMCEEHSTEAKYVKCDMCLKLTKIEQHTNSKDRLNLFRSSLRGIECSFEVLTNLNSKIKCLKESFD